MSHRGQNKELKDNRYYFMDGVMAENELFNISYENYIQIYFIRYDPLEGISSANMIALGDFAYVNDLVELEMEMSFSQVK